MHYAAVVQQALTYVESNLREEIRVENVAHAVHFSTSHLHAIFGKVTGCTLAEHVRKRRLACAALDLALSRKRILDIALEYRFDSQEAFTRSFKRLYGISPGHFRRHRAEAGITPRLGIYHPADIMGTKGAAAPQGPAVHPQSGLVLNGVPRVGFYLGGDQCPEQIPFPSCLAAALRYLGEDYPWIPVEAHRKIWRLNYANVYMLGASGMAFGLLWRPGWHQDNVDLMFLANPRDIIHRAFAAAGYTYEILEKAGGSEDGERYRQAVVASIGRGRPVLAFGVMGPPECCLITGYDEGGDVCLGWNYFQDQPNEYFRQRNWVKETQSLVVIRDRIPGFDPRASNREVLRWALTVARTPVMMGRQSGLHAYTAWAEQMYDDPAFATADEYVLRQRHEVHHSVVGNLAECRAWAGMFLREMAKGEPTMADDLQAAADCYTAEHDLMWQIWEVAGGPENPQAYAQFARPEVRRQIAALILKARALDTKAAEYLERALAL